MPTILIDADGCPVVDLTVRIGRSHGVPVKILCDTAHRIEREGAETLVFDKGADSVDFALVNRITPGDIVITQDYSPQLAGQAAAPCKGRGHLRSIKSAWHNSPFPFLVYTPNLETVLKSRSFFQGQFKIRAVYWCYTR